MPALDVTSEALLFSLRSGVGVLQHADVRRRLAELDKDQLAEACARVQRHKPHIAEQWTDAEVQQLIAAWDALS